MSENSKVITKEFANKTIVLTIFGEGNESSIFEPADAAENGEAPVQIQEGYFYEYEISDGYRLKTSEIVSQSKINPSTGRISPNIYVGTLTLIVEDASGTECTNLKLEVQSRKTSYRGDYRQMLVDITDKCTELLLQHNSPVSQLVEVDFNADAKTLYQRFAFIKSIIDSAEFNDSVYKIISSPVTRWKDCDSIKDIRAVKRMDSSALRQITSATNRMDLPDNHPLKTRIPSVPSKINITSKTETVDTPENRFVKYALNSFRSFIGDFRIKLKGDSRLKTEATLLESKLEEYLSHSVFKEISNPTTLPLNSPVLQRKEGYREILRVWLMFDLAARLVWHGGEDVYSSDKKDVAVLYEYWLFFKLLDILKELFDIEPDEIKDLIKETDDGLGLQLRQGKYIPLKGDYTSKNRKLHIEFSYNRAFSGKKDYPHGGSWTMDMRPDYTLSIWPFGISQTQAEKEELIVHIHFDAKYKIDNLSTIFGDISDKKLSEEEMQEELSTEKKEIIKGNVKRVDLLKMHSYKDAIRRTGGAYILYPGSEKYQKKGFHEIIPGLGAFAISPSDSNDGSRELKKFLSEVTEHFLNRASQREKISLKAFETYKTNEINEVNDLLPETYGENRGLLPDETFVLIGFYKDAEHLKWITSNKLYNARTGSTRGSLRLSAKETGAKYILLHTTGETITSRLFKLDFKGPRIFSKENMISKFYPNPSQEYYLVYDVLAEVDKEFENTVWDITQLSGYLGAHNSAIPFAVSLTELMKAVML
jgi:predicted component of viral defense system (DUF524 family)